MMAASMRKRRARQALLSVGIVALLGLLLLISSIRSLYVRPATPLLPHAAAGGGGGAASPADTANHNNNNDNNGKEGAAGDMEVGPLSHLMFVSCNRHERSQSYWRVMAFIADCEAANYLPLRCRWWAQQWGDGGGAVRLQLPPPLLSSRSQLHTQTSALASFFSLSAAPVQPHMESQWYYDTPFAQDSYSPARDIRCARYQDHRDAMTTEARGYFDMFGFGNDGDEDAEGNERQQNKDGLRRRHNNANDAGANQPLGGQNGRQQRQRPSGQTRDHQKASSLLQPNASLDAFLWLGDAIYADKRADGGDLMQMGRDTHNSLEAVKGFWEQQRQRRAYVTFRETCVAREWENDGPRAAAPPVLRNDDLIQYAQREKYRDWMLPLLEAAAAGARGGDPVLARGDGLRVYGTWDDHDMGKNDGGAEYPHRATTQRYLLHFLGASARDERWRREGVYDFRTLPFRALTPLCAGLATRGECAPSAAAAPTPSPSPSSSPLAGPASGAASLAVHSDGEELRLIQESLSLVYTHAVCLVLLDVRSFRDPATAAEDGDMLGAPQWEWLERLLDREMRDFPDSASSSPFSSTAADPEAAARARAGGGHPNGSAEPTAPRSWRRGWQKGCALTLIGGGIQFILDEKPSETWAAFPRSRDRLLHLLRRRGAERVAFLTGDIHMGEIGADFSDAALRTVGYPLVEATSSGLTHAAKFFRGLDVAIPVFCPTPRRVGIYTDRNFANARMDLWARDALAAADGGADVSGGGSGKPPRRRRWLTAGDEKTLRQLTSLARANADGSRDVSPAQAQEASRAAAAVLESIINVSFSVFALPENGRTVVRVTFPLEMLSYAHGGDYRGARVPEAYGGAAGYVQLNHQSGDPTAKTKEERGGETNVGARDPLPPYPNTQPVPFATWLGRYMQKHYFPTKNVTFAFMTTIKLALLVSVLVWGTLAAVFFLNYRRWRSKGLAELLAVVGVGADEFLSSHSNNSNNNNTGANSNTGGPSSSSLSGSRRYSGNTGRNNVAAASFASLNMRAYARHLCRRLLLVLRRCLPRRRPGRASAAAAAAGGGGGTAAAGATAGAGQVSLPSSGDGAGAGGGGGGNVISPITGALPVGSGVSTTESYQHYYKNYSHSQAQQTQQQQYANTGWATTAATAATRKHEDNQHGAGGGAGARAAGADNAADTWYMPEKLLTALEREMKDKTT